MTEPFVHTLRVRYSECDMQGVLFNANYLAYVDHTITEIWRAAYGGYTVMLERGVDVVVAEAGIRFKAAAHFDEELTIEALVTGIGTTSVRSEYRFIRGGRLLAEARLRHVFIDPATGAKTAVPDWARDGLARWLADPAGGAAGRDPVAGASAAGPAPGLGSPAAALDPAGPGPATGP